LTSAGENDRRRGALKTARGWRTGTGLFNGFPARFRWQYGVLDRDELERVRYIEYSYWIELSGGTRRPREVPAALRSGEFPQWMHDVGTDWCAEFATTLRSTRSLGDLIIVGTPDLDRLVALEGHARLTALFVAGLEAEIEVRAFVGTSEQIEEWALF
jgi:hypothetical protein